MPALNQKDAIHYIATRQEFTASALSGAFAHIGAGRLDNYETTHYNYAISKGADYFVYSYGTPIAFHSVDGWHIVEQKFSVTTSKHQNLTRRAIAESLAGVN